VVASPELRALARAALRLDDRSLEAACEIQFFIAGGPGGQHRNKTESAVRLTHAPTGITVSASERRSQAQNRSVALMRLRRQLITLTFVPRIRKPTKVSKAQRKARLEGKRQASAKKRDRAKPPSDF
jgi:protein subunit release factor B